MGKLGIIRRLAREVEGGLLAAHEGDPDLRKKDDDLKLLNVSDGGGSTATVDFRA